MDPQVGFELTTYISRHFIDNHYQYPKFYFHQDVGILTTHSFPFVVYGSFHYLAAGCLEKAKDKTSD